MWWIGSFSRGDDGGGGGGEPDNFARVSFWLLLAFGAIFYLLCATFVVHDLMAYRELTLGAPSVHFWIGERFGSAAGPCLFFALVLFIPAMAVWLLGRFFDAQHSNDSSSDIL